MPCYRFAVAPESRGLLRDPGASVETSIPAGTRPSAQPTRLQLTWNGGTETLTGLNENTETDFQHDDVYVAEGKRGMGIGSLLMHRVAAVAVERDVDARWHVETANRSAQKFYNALGAELRDRFIAYWPREAMRALIGPL